MLAHNVGVTLADTSRWTQRNGQDAPYSGEFLILPHAPARSAVYDARIRR